MSVREKIVAGNIYHVLNRGVDKRTVFLENADYQRFIQSLHEFNSVEPTNNLAYRFSKGVQPPKEVGHPYKEPLVDILGFCLMPNHYHLLLRPKSDGGISEFMKRMNGGYTLYFNEKHTRSGSLFQGKYKYVRISSDAHFNHILFYIHLNALDLKMPEWRGRELANWKAAMEFLENYRWSSFQDYIGKENFPLVTHRDFLLEYFGGTQAYKKATEQWLKEISNNYPTLKNRGFLLE